MSHQSQDVVRKTPKTPGQDQTSVKSRRLENYKEQPKTEAARWKHHQNASKPPVCLSKHRSDLELRATLLYNSTRDEKKKKRLSATPHTKAEMITVHRKTPRPCFLSQPPVIICLPSTLVSPASLCVTLQ